MFFRVEEDSRENAPSPALELTPSDQLLSIALVDLIILVVSWSLIYYGYGAPVHLPIGILLAGVGVVAVSGILASFETFLGPRVVKIAKGGHASADLRVVLNETFMKVMVFACTLATIVVLWIFVDHTDGLSGPFVPFLTMPAVLGPFVARNWISVAILCLGVVAAIWLLTLHGQSTPSAPDDVVYKIVAAAMVCGAGAIAAVRRRVEATGEPITGPAPTDPESG